MNDMVYTSTADKPCHCGATGQHCHIIVKMNVMPLVSLLRLLTADARNRYEGSDNTTAYGQMVAFQQTLRIITEEFIWQQLS